MMKLSAVLVCVTIVVLDVVAGVLGIEGEMAQNKVKHVRFFLFECRQPSGEAYRLGVAAASILLIAHILTNVAGGCVCFCSAEELQQSPANKQVAAACLLFSWIAVAVGFTLLILGALSNGRRRDFCSITRHKFLSIGGVICFIHGALSTAYYVVATAVNTEEYKTRRADQSVSMAERGQANR